ncbi:hypothetical protein Tco_0975538 [Tanacetum coccineum]|uniref:Xylulose kinase-1 n=1 Tax=Tanacetum coccineum TaxID=301880 RepID=A0ABQ5EEN6_9ASTR
MRDHERYRIPTIYASYIEQFWNTATSKTVNSVKQIHAIVDGKAVVISESSVRNDLLFDDKDGITCLRNDDIFENLALIGDEQLLTKLTFQKESALKPNEPPLPEGPYTREWGGRWNILFEFMNVLNATYIPKINLFQEGGRMTWRKEIDAPSCGDPQLKKRVESFDDDLDEEDASKQGRTSDKTKPMCKDSDFDDLNDLVDKGMAFIQEKDAENQGKIGADDTEVVKESGDTEAGNTTGVRYEREQKRIQRFISTKDSEKEAQSQEYQLLGKMEAKDMYVYKLTRADGSSIYNGDTQAFLKRLDSSIA